MMDDALHVGYRIALLLLLCAVFLAASLFNGLIVALFVKRKRNMRNVLDRFSLSLAALNLCCVLVAAPLLAVDLLAVAGRSRRLCVALDAAMTGMGAASSSAQLLIAADRLLGVAAALRYHALVTRARSLTAIGAGWTFTLVAATAAAIVAASGDVEASAVEGAHWLSCTAAARPESVVFSALLTALLFWAPLVGLVAAYGKIYRCARANSVRRRSTVASMLRPVVKTTAMRTRSLPDSTAATAVARSPRTRSAIFLTGHLRGKLSFTSQLRLPRGLGEERRTASVCCAVLALFVINWLPLALCRLLEARTRRAVTPAAQHLAALIGLSSACVTPLVYCLISRRVQDDLRRLLGLAAGAARGCRLNPCLRQDGASVLAVSAPLPSTDGRSRADGSRRPPPQRSLSAPAACPSATAPVELTAQFLCSRDAPTRISVSSNSSEASRTTELSDC